LRENCAGCIVDRGVETVELVFDLDRR
jgi:hypothetical protein